MPRCVHPEDRLALLFAARDYVTGDAFEIRRCGVCSLAITWPVPSADAMARYYPDAYYGRAAKQRFVGIIERLQRRLYDGRAKRIEAAVEASIEAPIEGRSRRVLDVGCGRGFLLDAFARRRWRVEGTERSATASAHAREVLGFRVHLGSLDALDLPADTFDAVTLWHVLEHIGDPAGLLDEVARLLRPGGVVFVGVPNFGSVEARAAGAGWFHLDVPRHLIHFTPTSLAATLEGAGFEIVDRAFFAPEYDAFSVVQSTLNRLGLRQNALYDLLRGHDARLGAADARGSVVASLALAPAIGLASLPASLLAGVMGVGSSCTMIAKKALARAPLDPKIVSSTT